LRSAVAQDAQNESSPSRVLVPSPVVYRVGLAVLVVLAVGSVVWWLVVPKIKRNSNSGSSAGTVVLPLESFTVNLADPEEGRFLRVTMALGVEGKLPPITKNESKEPEAGAVSMATIRDSILTVLAQYKSDELLTPEGKNKLKQDLLAALNRDVAPLGAREIYFTEFLVQR
jgi:flagellar basal body-associated protein FliL